jgi:tol-pal system protein YbgF
MKQLLFMIFLMSSWCVCAEDQIVVNTLDSPIASNDQNLSSNYEDRFSTCESKIQNLISRVEVLEHEIQALKSGGNVNSSQQVSSQPVISTSEVNNTSQSVPNTAAANGDEKISYDKALAALKESKFEESESMFDAFIQQYPNSDLSGNASFWYAETFYRRGDFDKAAVNYLKGYKKYPKSPKAADSLLKLALSLGELKKKNDACAVLDKLEAEYKHRPSSSIKRAHDARIKYGCKG